MKTTRRNFITKSVMTAAGITAGVNSGLLRGSSSADNSLPSAVSGAVETDAFKISVFSKHLHWLDYQGMAKALADLGFDGADLKIGRAHV